MIAFALLAVTLAAGSTDVVIEKGAPATVRFAAAEMTNLLSKVFGAAVPIVHDFAPGRAAIVLGSNGWSRAAGLRPETLPRDGFQVKAEGGRVYIAGADDPKSHPDWLVNTGGYPRTEMSTLFGVYEFLERYAGCRFYFPGEIGTITPRSASLAVPDGQFSKSPDFTVRYVYLSGDGDGYGPRNAKGGYPEKSLNWMRLRMETERTPCCHGINSFNYPERFGATHPEYFQLRADGTRCTNLTYNGSRHDYRIRHLCYSSAITNVIYEDVRERLLKGERYVDVMPQDGSAQCLCDLCRPRYRTDTKDSPATEHIWGWCAALGRRLIDNGVPGEITMMAYSPYRRVPDFPLPTNILVMVAEQGPWQKVDPAGFARANGEVKAWAEKIGRKVWVWTYPHKHQQSALPGVPQMTPRAWGEYYQGLAPWIFGSFAETESDRWIYNYLNYYVFSRVAWDSKVDLDAVLDEHYRLMFAAADADMKAFYELLERTWLEGVMNHVDDTPLGPVARVPPPLAVWREVYSPAMLDRCEALFRSAFAKVGPESMEFRRLKFIREQLYDPLRAESSRYLNGISVAREQADRAARRPVNLVDRFPDAWYNPGRSTPPERDRATCVTTNGSFRLQRDYANVKWFLDLKPETTYRVSYYVKLDAVVRRPDWKGTSGGFLVEFCDGNDETRHPYPIYEDGTFDWIHRSFPVKTPPKDAMKKRPYVMPWMLHGQGTTWVDGVLVEEMPK